MTTSPLYDEAKQEKKQSVKKNTTTTYINIQSKEYCVHDM